VQVEHGISPVRFLLVARRQVHHEIAGLLEIVRLESGMLVKIRLDLRSSACVAV
jgi:hypothetical protein